MINRDINLCKKYEFYNLNFLDDFDVRVQSIVILPSNSLHDSGYRLFSVVAIDEFNNLLGQTEPYDIFDFGDITFGKIDLLKCGLFRIQFSHVCTLNNVFHRIKEEVKK